MTPTARRRLLILIAVVLVIGGGAVGFYKYQSRKLHYQLIAWKDAGLQARQHGDWPKAIENLSNYLRKVPNDHEALNAFIESRPHVELPKHAEVNDTITALERFLALEPHQRELRQQLVSRYVSIGRDTEARESAKALLDQSEGKDPVALRALAMIDSRLKNYDEALQMWDKLLKIQPTDLRGQMQRLWTLKAYGRPKAEYLKLADELLKSPDNRLPGNTPDPRFEVLKAYALELADVPAGTAMTDVGGEGDARSIGELLRTAARRIPPDTDFSGILVEELNRHGLYDDALLALRRVADDPDAKDRAAADALLVTRLWELRQWPELLQRTEKIADDKIADALPESDVRLLAMRAFGLLYSGRRPDAEVLGLKLANRKDSPVSIAWAMVLNNEFKPGTQNPVSLQAAIRRVPPTYLDTYLYFYLGDCYSRMGESEMAARTWQTSAIQSPTWALPLECLANVLMERGRTDAALAAAKIAALRSRDTKGNVVGSPAMTLIRIETADLENPNRHVGNTTIAERGLLKEVDEIQAATPGEPFTLPIQIALLAKLSKVEKGAPAQEAKDRANKLMQGVLAESGRPSEDMLLRLAVVSRGYGMPFESLCLERCEKLYGVTPNLAMVRAGAFMAAGKRAEGVAYIKSASERRSNSESNLSWDLAIARTLEMAHDPESKVNWQKIAATYPDSLAAQESVLNAISVESDRELIDQTIDRLEKLTGGDGLLWRVARARWLIGAGAPSRPDLETAATLLNEVLNSSPDYADAHFLLSRTLELLGDLDGAIDHMRLASNSNPTSTATAVHLVRLLQSKGEFQKAGQLLEQLAGHQTKDPAQRRQIAVLLAQAGRTQDALKVMLDSDTPQEDPADLLTASLYEQQGQFDKAQAICEKLLKTPDPAVVQFAAGLYAARGDKTHEEQTLALLNSDALKLPPGQKESILAQHKTRYGTPEEADRWFKAATQAGPKDSAIWQQLIAWDLQNGNPKDALAATDDALKNIPDDRTLQTIKQSGSLLTQASKGPELRPLCAAIVDPSIPRGAVTEALDTILKARAADPANTFSAVQDVANRYPLLLPLQLYVVEAGRREGHPEEAVAAARRVTFNFPARSEGPRIAANLLMEMNQWTEAIGMAKDWGERSIRDTLRADVLIARARLELKQGSEVLTLLKDYIPEAQAHLDSDVHAEALIFYSIALILQGDSDQAYTDVNPLLAKNVSRRTLWGSAALRYLDELAAKQALERIAALTDPKSEPEQVQLAEGWALLSDRSNGKYISQAKKCLEPLLVSPDVSAPVLSMLGNLEEKQTNFDAAEKYYRQAIKRDPAFFTANNNLAMCLIRKGDSPEVAQEAVAAAQAALKVNPIAPIYDTLSRAQAKAHDADGALASMKMSVKMDPNSFDRRLNLISLLLDYNHADEARSAISSLETAAGTAMPDDIRQRLHALRQRMESGATLPAASR